MKKTLSIVALMLASAGGIAAEQQENALAPTEPQTQEVLRPSIKLDEQAELMTQRKTDDAMQRINDEISREMDEKLSERYAASD